MTKRMIYIPNVSRGLDGLVKWANDILTGEVKLPILVDPAFKILPEGRACNRHIVPINEFVLQQVVQDLCETPRHIRN